ncbi:hypothetical protein PHYSODRAFT_338314 [Phytophthora sojae]|uniref:Uncharacterized protein n=1 Tax=Phytophthora sojae (strain P6497) TaxID=1094619 RepID=G5A4D7_PHYSP|nr:hypothetical protein PHYSODRAFT_338314 [Phytophthora sojae]EGZ09538.1 hypothetical protein PHYSODRAFT_338314 [Phytophthora sojae]|eukprot:XP_009534399.1 hypothetical protein PHYSODRAFT_338314 [Phytophthora sojae]
MANSDRSDRVFRSKSQDQHNESKLGERHPELLVGLYDMDDIQLRDTVEGDGIRQVLMESSRHRAGREFPRRYTEPVKVRDRAPGLIVEQTEDFRAVTANGLKYEKAVEEEHDSTEQDSNSSSSSMLQWVGTLVIGISMLLTWPIGLAYMRG